MNTYWKTITLSSVLIMILSACGGSNVGNQKDEAPIAEASVFGSNVATNGTVQVRAGSEVLLSGQSSNGVDDPILHFTWTQIDDNGYPVTLFERNTASRVFTAPHVPFSERDGVELEFHLLVEDADGVQDTDTIIVNVMPSSDVDHFLSRPMNIETYAIIVVADEGAVLTEDMPISVTLSERVEWTDRQGVERTRDISSKVLSGIVPAGTTSTITDKSNQYFIEPVPLLDTDEVNQYFQAEARDARLEFERVEDARLIIDLTVGQQAIGNLKVYLARNGETGLTLIDTDSVALNARELEFTEEWLRQQILIESRLSANNYYKCIDPLDQSTTLQDWLDQAGFYNATDISHSTYLNNYDLNFGRDMYVRQDENNNVYSYVINYPTLESALSRRNDFAVVVMEFSPAPTGQCGDGTFAAEDGKKIVKFYAYVPDETTGDYIRAPTMNFDGRGERSLPGVCIACHFGDANAEEFGVADVSTINASAADLDSSFMIWDLDAFLYTSQGEGTQVDQAYVENEISAEVTAQYSREAQEDVLREQNQSVLHTFTYDVNQLKRFEIPIKLLHGLYQNADAVDHLNFGTQADPLTESELSSLQEAVSTLPMNTFDGENYVQPGWVGQEALYHQVFARNCRLCHAQIGERALDFDSYDEFITNNRLVPYVFEQGIMPLSRLTMDRFWTNFYSDQSAAELLRTHLNSDMNPNNDVPDNLLPGTPVAIVSPERNSETAADIIVDFDEPVLLDGTASLFSDGYQWRVDDSLVSTESKLLFTPSMPGQTQEIEFNALNREQFLISDTLTRSILVSDNTPTIDSVPAQSIVEGSSLDIDLYTLLCPAGTPDSAVCRRVFGDIPSGGTPTINIVGNVTNGILDDVNSTTGTVAFRSTAAEAAGAAAFNFTITDAFAETSAEQTMTINVNALGGPQIVGPDTCSTTANSHATISDFPVVFNSVACPDPSANDTAEGSLTLSLVSVNDSALRAGSSVVLNGGNIEYIPGRFFIGQDNFSYTVQDNSLSAQTSTGNVMVNVEAQQTFTSLSTGNGIFADTNNPGCASCHAGQQAPAAPNWLNAENVRLASASRVTQPYVSTINLSEPTTTETLLESIFFQNACNGNGSHTGGNRLCVSPGLPTQVSDLNDSGRAILQWLEEGAQDN